MKCPNCSEHLITLEFANIEVDHCFNCLGIWLDMGEMRQLFEKEDTAISTITAGAAGEKRKRCPVCRKGMQKVRTGKAESVLLDQCMLHGFWFDEGELKKLLALSCREEMSNPLIKLLDEMFAARKGGCT